MTETKRTPIDDIRLNSRAFGKKQHSQVQTHSQQISFYPKKTTKESTDLLCYFYVYL